MTLLDHALELARLGVPVFPLKPGEKVPFEGSRGVLDASTDPGRIREWWRYAPNASIGLACGGAGFDVVDLDVKKVKGVDRDGVAALGALAAGRPLPPCPVAFTPTGGVHLFFRADPARPLSNRTGMAPGVDVRASGGYVVAAPSVRNDCGGAAYAWASDGPALADAPAMPEWLRELVGAHVERQVDRVRLAHDYPPAAPAVLEAAREALRHHGPSVYGSGGNVHAYRAGALLLNDFALDWDDEALPLAREWNETCKCDARPDGWSETALERVLHNGKTYASRPRGAARDPLELGAERPLTPPPVVTYTPMTGEPAAAAATSSDEEDDPAPAEAPTFERLNASLVRERMPRETVLSLLQRTDKGKVTACGANASLLLRHLFHGQFRFNMLEKTVDASRSLFRRETPDTLPKAVSDWLTLEPDVEAPFSPAMVADALLLIGTENAFNPLREYLLSLKWDGVERIDSWLASYAHARLVDDEGTDVTPYVREVGSRWLIAAAARALYPGCKADVVLVLEGVQGSKKSTVFDVLGGQWFADTPLRIGDKDANLGAGSSWIIELAELASLRKAESESQKQFLSGRVDTFRVPYGRTTQKFPRACIFGGTTNETTYLYDRTGNRRYWCVSVAERADEHGLRRDRDQLWAEAVHRLHRAPRPDLCRELEGPHEQGPGQRWWFEPAEQLVADHVAASRAGEDAADAYEDVVERWLLAVPQERQAAGLSAAFVAESALKIPVERYDRRVSVPLAAVMKKLGWRRSKPNDKWLWFPTKEKS